MNELQKLLTQKAALEEKIAATRQAEKARVIADVRSKIALFSFSERELGFDGKAPKAAQPARKPGPAMYRDPETGVTWSGRGRTPGWIAGQDRSRFLIPA